MKKHRFNVLFALAFCFLASPSFAQAPALTRSQHLLPINYYECMNRAKSGLGAEGFNIHAEVNRAVIGQKQIHTAIIMCTPSPDGRIWADIVVASSAIIGGSPDAERAKLDMRMAGSNPASFGCSGFNGRWRISSGGQLIIALNGHQANGIHYFSGGQANIRGVVKGNVLEGEWKTNAGYGWIQLELYPDGNRFRGRTWKADKTPDGEVNGLCLGGN